MDETSSPGIIIFSASSVNPLILVFRALEAGSECHMTPSESDALTAINSQSLCLALLLGGFSSAASLPNRKSSTVPDSVAMMMLARKRPSPVIQVTVKQTETDPGLIGVVSYNKRLNTRRCERATLTYIMS